MATQAQAQESKDSRLPPVVNGELGSILSVKVVGKKTKPPEHYTEASLLADMEGAGKFVEDSQYKKVLKKVSGLGTAATRAQVIEGLKHDGLIETKGKKILSTPLGESLIDFIPAEAYDVARTAKWEADLSLIESEGGRPRFEKSVVENINLILAELDKRAPLTQPKGARPVSSGATNKPTEKMLEFAKKLATQNKISLPADVSTSFDACKAFLDQHAKASPPSEKALKWARDIASKKGITLDSETEASSQLLSKWLDANK